MLYETEASCNFNVWVWWVHVVSLFMLHGASYLSCFHETWNRVVLCMLVFTKHTVSIHQSPTYCVLYTRCVVQLTIHRKATLTLIQQFPCGCSFHVLWIFSQWIMLSPLFTPRARSCGDGKRSLLGSGVGRTGCTKRNNHKLLAPLPPEHWEWLGRRCYNWLVSDSLRYQVTQPVPTEPCRRWQCLCQGSVWEGKSFFKDSRVFHSQILYRLPQSCESLTHGASMGRNIIWLISFSCLS